MQQAITCLLEGKIIAYPTEAVFGLGCDPFNEHAVLDLIQLKGRPLSKGLILIASNWDQIQPFIQPLTLAQKKEVNNSWPGPITWVFPASDLAPTWILGDHSTIAFRMSNHPHALALCNGFQKPIVSTSANKTGQPPATTYQQVHDYFGEQLCFVIDGKVGDLKKPTIIRDLLTGRILRE